MANAILEAVRSGIRRAESEYRSAQYDLKLLSGCDYRDPAVQEATARCESYIQTYERVWGK